MSVFLELYKEPNFGTPSQQFTKIGSYPELSKELSEACSSLQMELGTWAVLYEKPYYKGLSKLVGSDTVHSSDSSLANDTRNDYQGTPGLNWDNQIGSVRLFDHKPNNLDLILTNFLGQYDQITEEGHEIEWDDNYYYISYKMQGCTFKMNYPRMGQRTISNDFMEFSIHFQHVLDLNDEEAVLHFAMNKEGDFVEKATVKYSNGIFQIPDWVISLADFTIDMAANVISKGICKLENKLMHEDAIEKTEDVVEDTVGIIEDGAEEIGDKEGDDDDGEGLVNEITDKIIQGMAKCLTFCVDHINQVINGLASYVKQKDGGSLYFSSVVSHALLRLINAYMDVIDEQTGGNNNTNLTVDNAGIASALGTSWNQRRGAFVCSGEVYTVDIPDVTIGHNKLGLYSSVKINDEEKDENHVVLNLIADSVGELTYLQGSMYIHSFDYDADHAPNSGMIYKGEDGNCYQVLRKGEEENSFQAKESMVYDDEGLAITDIIQAFEICLGRSLYDSEENYHQNFDASITKMPVAAAKVASAIMEGISVG